MKRYLTQRPVFSIIVFILTCASSTWFFKKQPPSAPLAVTNPLPIFASTKFTKVGQTPTKDDSRFELQFINEREGWLADRRDLWHTHDGGLTWELIFQIQPGSDSRFAELQFVNSKQGWATFYNYLDLYKTEDGGRTWMRVVTPLDDTYASLWTFHLEPSGTGWIAGGVYHPMKLDEGCPNNARGSLPSGVSTCLKGAVFRTYDGGDSWQEQPVPRRVGRFMSITFTDSEHGWVTGDAGVFQTADRGQTWSTGKFRRECENFYELPDRHPASTHFVDDKTGWLVLSSGQIAKTSDGGKTWCDQFEPESLWPYDAGHVGPTRQFKSIHFRNANYGIGLGVDGLVYETLDAGATWRQESTLVRFETLVFVDKTNGWAISKDHELYRVRLGVAHGSVAAREEPRQLIDIFTDEDLFYKGYEVRKLNETSSELEVSQVVLMKDGKRVPHVDPFYFLEDSNAEFGLFDLMGEDSEQIIVSQTRPRSGRHWVVRVTPYVRVLFDSLKFGVGREEFYVVDIDKDNVYELVLPMTTFYAMQDKMPVGQIPLPQIVFKYDSWRRKYQPANHRFADYVLHDIESDIEKLSNDDSTYLSARLNILLRYVYARKATQGWAFFERAYQRPDREQIVDRIRSVLKNDPVYNYIY